MRAVAKTYKLKELVNAVRHFHARYGRFAVPLRFKVLRATPLTTETPTLPSPSSHAAGAWPEHLKDMPLNWDLRKFVDSLNSTNKRDAATTIALKHSDALGFPIVVRD